MPSTFFGIAKNGPLRRAVRFQFRQLLTFPGSRPPSILSVTELNYRVRNGNGCDPRSRTAETISKAVKIPRKGAVELTKHSWIRAAHAARTETLKERKSSHGLLVPLGSMHRCTYTCGLSTSWSTTVLQGVAPGRPDLGNGFTLRCLQRFSDPYMATRQCRWRDSRYTRGASVPVLSY